MPGYVYARDAFGDFAGFLHAWPYWITAWAGNAAIVVALFGLWIPAVINMSAAIALVSCLGIETASVAAGRVRDPKRNVGRTTVPGAIGCAVVYILGTVFGTVPNAALQASAAPLVDSADAILAIPAASSAGAVAAPGA